MPLLVRAHFFSWHFKKELMLGGDLYIGQQAFGGARASGTNDKAGSSLNLIRWVSPRTIKESFVPIEQVAYPSNSI